jgi:hypothetical protein
MQEGFELAHVACIVLGNDGYDAISDHSQGPDWDDVMKISSEYCDKLGEK